jgi:hypothetical protein
MNFTMDNIHNSCASTWSLFELLKVKAEHYIHIGRVFQYWMSGNDELILTEENRQRYSDALTQLIEACDLLGLPVSIRLIRNALNEAQPGNYIIRPASKMGELHRCVEAELQSSLYFLVPPNRAPYMAVFEDSDRTQISAVGEELKRFTPVIKAFPSTIYDLEEAGSCYAFGVFTACVFHLMRVCEYGLVSLAESLGEDPGISSWEKLLRKIRDKISDAQATKPTNWKELAARA